MKNDEEVILYLSSPMIHVNKRRNALQEAKIRG
ncbi:hypothetical protein BBR47_38740 [Brevibacillus brevis NBRC 100599]|uniref:Uncharacterized protein n=1 Tax=Brevibacillus brevis (strain 47 / JCM 6285 / NBRC 100599) TaxID=358681 RepID=C0ZGE2_BREBN|nr:hypothetical protein BBR47_38740 [Brevibacillus brevis NBRC 100599]